jgi:hypothetical protein
MEECKYCKEEALEIIVTHIKDNCKIEIGLEDGELFYNTFDNQYTFTEDICGHVKIKFCPICGKEINRDTMSSH